MGLIASTPTDPLENALKQTWNTVYVWNNNTVKARGSLQKVEHSIKKLACVVHTTKIVMFLFIDK